MLHYKCAFNRQVLSLNRYELADTFDRIFGESKSFEIMSIIDEYGKFFIRTDSGTIAIHPTYH